MLAFALGFFTLMSPEQIDEMGLSKLTIQEKMSLHEWVEEHYEKKILAQNKKKDPIIEEVIKGGRFIRLSDKTLWEIDPKSTLITQSWITPVEIKVTSNKDTKYPYTLTNTLTGSSVLARKKDPSQLKN